MANTNKFDLNLVGMARRVGNKLEIVESYDYFFNVFVVSSYIYGEESETRHITMEDMRREGEWKERARLKNELNDEVKHIEVIQDMNERINRGCSSNSDEHFKLIKRIDRMKTLISELKTVQKKKPLDETKIKEIEKELDDIGRSYGDYRDWRWPSSRYGYGSESKEYKAIYFQIDKYSTEKLSRFEERKLVISKMLNIVDKKNNSR